MELVGRNKNIIQFRKDIICSWLVFWSSGLISEAILVQVIPLKRGCTTTILRIGIIFSPKNWIRKRSMFTQAPKDPIGKSSETFSNFCMRILSFQKFLSSFLILITESFVYLTFFMINTLLFALSK